MFTLTGGFHSDGRLSASGGQGVGVVTLLGAGVPDDVSGRGGAGFRAGAQAVVGQLTAPVTWSQMANRSSAEVWVVGSPGTGNVQVSELTAGVAAVFS